MTSYRSSVSSEGIIAYEPIHGPATDEYDVVYDVERDYLHVLNKSW